MYIYIIGWYWLNLSGPVRLPARPVRPILALAGWLKWSSPWTSQWQICDTHFFSVSNGWSYISVYIYRYILITAWSYIHCICEYGHKTSRMLTHDEPTPEQSDPTQAAVLWKQPISSHKSLNCNRIDSHSQGPHLPSMPSQAWEPKSCECMWQQTEGSHS